MAFVSNSAHAERLEQHKQTKLRNRVGRWERKTQKADKWRFSDNVRKGGKRDWLVTPFLQHLNDPKIYKYSTSTKLYLYFTIQVPGSVPSTEVIPLSMPAGQPIDSYITY